MQLFNSVLGPKDLILTSTVTLNINFLITFLSLQITSRKLLMFLKPSAALWGSELLDPLLVAERSQCLLSVATTLEESKNESASGIVKS